MVQHSHILYRVFSNFALQVDSMTLAYATSRLNGISSPANAAYSASELEFQMKNAGAKALFTVRVTIRISISDN